MKNMQAGFFRFKLQVVDFQRVLFLDGFIELIEMLNACGEGHVFKINSWIVGMGVWIFQLGHHHFVELIKHSCYAVEDFGTAKALERIHNELKSFELLAREGQLVEAILRVSIIISAVCAVI